MTWNFGDVSEELGRKETARFGVVPVPFERTTSYGKGAGQGPEAIVAASRYLELFDEVYRFQPADAGIWTAESISSNFETLDAALHHIYASAAEHVKTGKFLVFLGGEHSITFPIVQAYREHFPGLSVLQFDAHADLRPEYEGTVHSHACVMRRVVSICRCVQVGIRSLSVEEYQALPELDTTVVFAHEFFADRDAAVQKILANLGPDVYITFDLDGFDPSLLPATGTPEPGGFFWADALMILERVFASRTVVGCDLVELAPMAGFHAGDFLAAKLAYKMMAMKQFFATT
jgi:agmatinase